VSQLTTIVNPLGPPWFPIVTPWHAREHRALPAVAMFFNIPVVSDDYSEAPARECVVVTRRAGIGTLPAVGLVFQLPVSAKLRLSLWVSSERPRRLSGGLDAECPSFPLMHTDVIASPSKLDLTGALVRIAAAHLDSNQ